MIDDTQIDVGLITDRSFVFDEAAECKNCKNHDKKGLIIKTSAYGADAIPTWVIGYLNFKCPDKNISIKWTNCVVYKRIKY